MKQQLRRWFGVALVALLATTAGPVRAQLEGIQSQTLGKQKLKVKSFGKAKEALELAVTFASNGSFSASDVEDTTFTGTWVPAKRKSVLELDPTSRTALVDALESSATALTGVPVSVALDEVKLDARINKKGTKVKVKGKVKAFASDAAGEVRKATWTFKTSGPVGGSALDLSGTITSAEASFVDSDVNDPNVVSASNDSVASAQALPAPATVGGYVNEPFAGADGASFQNGDPFDIFRVELAAGSVIALFIGEDPNLVDLDLDLADETGVILDTSEGIENIELLEVPADGTYLIQVRTFELCACASTYVLSIGQPLPAGRGPVRNLRLTDPFVPGEVVARARTKRASGAGSASSRGAFAAAHGMRVRAGALDREMLLALEPEPEATLGALGVDAGRRVGGLRPPADPELRARWETLAAVKALRRRADVETADLNYLRQPQLVPNDEFYSFQWHYPLINLPQAWDVTTGSPNVVVAVLDTGVLLAHPDLQGQLGPGFDFIASTQISRDGDGIDADPNDPGDLAFGGSSSFHGTHVSGTVAARSNDGTGVAGIAWQTRIMPIRVLGQGGGTTYDIIQGVRYAAGLSNDSGTVPATPADVMNLSLGGGGFSQSSQNAFLAARAAGTIVVAAAGNESSSQPSFPAGYDGVVSVSATDLNADLAPYSNFGSTIDVAAPGGDTRVDRNGDGYADGVLSTAADDSSGPIAFNFQFQNGTSMASPHMAGVVGLMKAVAPGMTPDQLDGLLDGSLGTITTDLGAGGRDDLFGHGLIDARAAVLAAQQLGGGQAPPPQPTLAASPTALNFATSLGQLPFQLSNAGEGALTVTSVTDDASWLSVAPDSTDAEGLGSWLATVDRSGLADGLYQATITAESSANDIQIGVVMRVGVPVGSDTGLHYVLLLDPVTFDLIGEAAVLPVDGRYDYAFSDVPPGRYFIVAGTDLDNDFVLCHGGEACGGYPTVDLLGEIEVNEDLDGLDFTTGFLQRIGSLGASAPGSHSAEGIRRLGAGEASRGLGIR